MHSKLTAELAEIAETQGDSAGSACSAVNSETLHRVRSPAFCISSLWDITRSDTFTPAGMLHFGIPLGTHPAHPVYFVGEGRLFFDHIDDVSNNYQFWGGVRVRF